MDIEWLRDLLICVCGIVITVVLIAVLALSHSLYRRICAGLTSIEAISDRIGAALASMEATAEKARAMADSFETIPTTVRALCVRVREDIINPAVEVAALIRDIRDGIDTIGKLFGKKEGGTHG